MRLALVGAVVALPAPLVEVRRGQIDEAGRCVVGHGRHVEGVVEELDLARDVARGAGELPAPIERAPRRIGTMKQDVHVGEQPVDVHAQVVHGARGVTTRRDRVERGLRGGGILPLQRGPRAIGGGLELEPRITGGLRERRVLAEPLSVRPPGGGARVEERAQQHVVLACRAQPGEKRRDRRRVGEAAAGEHRVARCERAAAAEVGAPDPIDVRRQVVPPEPSVERLGERAQRAHMVSGSGRAHGVVEVPAHQARVRCHCRVVRQPAADQPCTRLAGGLPCFQAAREPGAHLGCPLGGFLAPARFAARCHRGECLGGGERHAQALQCECTIPHRLDVVRVRREGGASGQDGGFGLALDQRDRGAVAVGVGRVQARQRLCPGGVAEQEPGRGHGAGVAQLLDPGEEVERERLGWMLAGGAGCVVGPPAVGRLPGEAGLDAASR